MYSWQNVVVYAEKRAKIIIISANMFSIKITGED